MGDVVEVIEGGGLLAVGPVGVMELQVLREGELVWARSVSTCFGAHGRVYFVDRRGRHFVLELDSAPLQPRQVSEDIVAARDHATDLAFSPESAM